MAKTYWRVESPNEDGENDVSKWSVSLEERVSRTSSEVNDSFNYSSKVPVFEVCEDSISGLVPICPYTD